ncbi:hypothetical protein BDR07DRAFT_954280 [Suillus spraguei]|nr:hypothetical protein BDR07DRAFT_954280 [Suillus spraguei]
MASYQAWTHCQRHSRSLEVHSAYRSKRYYCHDHPEEYLYDIAHHVLWLLWFVHVPMFTMFWSTFLSVHNSSLVTIIFNVLIIRRYPNDIRKSSTFHNKINAFSYLVR